MQAVDLGFEDLVALDSARWALNQMAHDMHIRGLVESARELRVQERVIELLADRAREVPT